MKGLYLPTKDDLYQMQSSNANIYKYLVAKNIEALIFNSKDKEILKNIHKYQREDPNIARGICMIKPDEIPYSDVVKYDIELCNYLLQLKPNTIYRLDNLSYFNTSTQFNQAIMVETIITLYNELNNNPEYRFNYKESRLLNQIFTCDSFAFSTLPRKIKEMLVSIEPAYAINFGYLDIVNKSINEYATRYLIDNDLGLSLLKKDIITNPDKDVKRLLKTIKLR